MFVCGFQRTKKKLEQLQDLLRPLLVSLVPSDVVWAPRCAKTSQTVSITIMSVMENQTAEMAQMRKVVSQIVELVGDLNWPQSA